MNLFFLILFKVRKLIEKILNKPSNFTFFSFPAFIIDTFKKSLFETVSSRNAYITKTKTTSIAMDYWRGEISQDPIPRKRSWLLGKLELLSWRWASLVFVQSRKHTHKQQNQTHLVLFYIHTSMHACTHICTYVTNTIKVKEAISLCMEGMGGVQ